MRIAILGKMESWHVERLRETGIRLGHEIVLVNVAEVVAELGGSVGTLKAGNVDLLQVDRVLVRSIPSGSLEQIVFRMDALARLALAGVPVLNPPKAIETCVDKYLTTARLAHAGLPVPRTIVCESAAEARNAVERLGGEVVIKPLFGSEGKGIVRVRGAQFCPVDFENLMPMGSVWYVQQFVEHPGYDFRALVIGDRIVAAMKRSSATDFRTNASLGATVEPCELPEAWQELAIRAAAVVGASIAGVDLLTDRQGEPLVLEVNSIPGFRALARTTEVDIPRAMIEHLCRHGKD